MQKDSGENLNIWGDTYHLIRGNDGGLQEAEIYSKETLYFTTGYDVCYADENGLVGYTAASGTAVQLMNWTNSGLVYSHGVHSLVLLSPETVYLYGSDGIGGNTGLLKYTKADDIILDNVDIIRVTYTEDGRNQIPLAAVKFNAIQSEYRIVCEELSSIYDGEDMIDSFDKTVFSSNVGDIVVTRNFDSLRKYGEKGVFSDLYSLMNDELSADDIFGCVRQACGINGKLYGLPSDFRLETYAASNGADSETWNMEAFIKFANSLKDGKRLLLNMTQNDVYYALRDSVISECINLENHTCSFDSDTFRIFLEYIASLPKESTDGGDMNENYYFNGKVALYDSDISSYASYYQMKSVFGEKADVDIIGYPPSEGGAAKLTSDAFYSVAETSKVKDGAMAFLRYLLSADCVIDEMRGMRSIPSLKTTAKVWDESEGKLYYFFYYDNVGRWSADTKPITSKDEGSLGVCIQLTPEKLNEVYDFFDNVNVYPYIPSDIEGIIDEDMSAFMNTAKTAEETAKVIQNRVSTYLSERK